MNIVISIDEKRKKQADDICTKYGLLLEQAIECFIDQILKNENLLLDVVYTEPNEVTIAAIEEIKTIGNNSDTTIGHTNIHEFFDNLLKGD